MEDLYEKDQNWNLARKEHNFISKAFIEKNYRKLIDRYGSLNYAEARLGNLEHFLNYHQEKV